MRGYSWRQNDLLDHFHSYYSRLASLNCWALLFFCSLSDHICLVLLWVSLTDRIKLSFRVLVTNFDCLYDTLALVSTLNNVSLMLNVHAKVFAHATVWSGAKVDSSRVGGEQKNGENQFQWYFERALVLFGWKWAENPHWTQFPFTKNRSNLNLKSA